MFCKNIYNKVSNKEAYFSAIIDYSDGLQLNWLRRQLLNSGPNLHDSQRWKVWYKVQARPTLITQTRLRSLILSSDKTTTIPKNKHPFLYLSRSLYHAFSFDVDFTFIFVLQQAMILYKLLVLYAFQSKNDNSEYWNQLYCNLKNGIGFPTCRVLKRDEICWESNAWIHT